MTRQGKLVLFSRLGKNSPTQRPTRTDGTPPNAEVEAAFPELSKDLSIEQALNAFVFQLPEE